MNRKLVGEPGVSAFLRSVRQNLSGDIITWMEASYTSLSYYDPRKDLKSLKEKLTFVQDLLVDGEARRHAGEESVDEWMFDIKHLLYDVEDFLDDMKSLSNDLQARNTHELYLTSDELKRRFGEILDRIEALKDGAKELELKRGSHGYALWGESKVTLRETSSMVEQQSTMNRHLVSADPGVFASLQSALQTLGDISRMEPTETTFNYYDPTQGLEKLNEKLVFVQGLVVDGEAKRLADPGVDKWMDDLKHLLYDVENILDDIKSLSNHQVHNLSVGVNSMFEKNILARAGKLGEIAETLKLQRGGGHVLWGESKFTPPTRETSSLVDLSQIHGREQDKTSILNRLLEFDGKGKKNYDVVGIWGMEGLGKTTLAQLVFNDRNVIMHFHVMRWVCISDVFDVTSVIKGLIGDRTSTGDADSLQNLHQRLQEIFENKRFLFVLDDVCSSPELKNKWNMIKVLFDSCANGSKILVTTRDYNIAQALGDEEPYQLEVLPHERCMLLFEDEAFGNAGVDEREKERLMIWGEKIVSACKGVPLEVKVIGSMLQRAKEEMWRAVAEKANLCDWLSPLKLHELCRSIEYRFDPILARAEYLGEKATKLNLKRGIESDFWADSKVTLRTREEDKSLIVKRLLKVDAESKNNYDVVGIWGEGGLGKTTLARLVYNDPVFEKHFEVRRWMRRSAIKGLIGDGSAGDAISPKSLEKMVQNKRFFFVLDDVRSSTEWDIIIATLDSCQNGSKILITTRDCYIAQVLGDEEPYELKGLPHQQCMSLFVDMAFGYGETDEGKQEKLNLGKKIVRACKGVPLAVKVIGSMLQRAGSEKWRTVSEKADHWHTVDINDEIHPAIRLSYHYLPACLKRCFEYLAVVPPGYEFEQDDVVRLWIAGGLVQEVKGGMAEDTGNEYYNQLKARSLIQENNMMHDVVHHLATEVSRKFCYEENSTVHLESMRHAFLVNNLDEFEAPYLRTLIVEEPEDEHLLGNTILSCKMLRTLKILSSKRLNWTMLVGGSSIGDLTHLRYVTINHSDVRHLPDSLCMLHSLYFLDLGYNEFLEYLPNGMNHLSNLRLLKVHKSSILCLPDSICTLSQLQVLNLSYCGRLKELPKDIGKLRSLRTLDLRKTSILSVPDSILYVTGLQNLLVDEHKQLPLHIGRLAGLEELPDYHVGKEEGSRLSELNLMNSVKGKLTIASMENIEGVEEAKMADLKSKQNVRELEFRWTQPGNVEEIEVKIMEDLEPHLALESLTFSNYGGDKFPAWIIGGNISFCNLASLRMEGLNKMCEMVDMEFVSLKVLSIKNCPVLRKVLMATPKLRELIMWKCRELEADSVHLLSNLSNKVGLHSIVSQLTELECDFNIFDYFFEKLKTENLIWEKLRRVRLSAGGTRVSSLPAGWPSMMDCLHTMDIVNIRPGKFHFLTDGV